MLTKRWLVMTTSFLKVQAQFRPDGKAIWPQALVRFKRLGHSLCFLWCWG